MGEDVAVAQALSVLARIGKVRSPADALLVLRSASNFVESPPGKSAASILRTGGSSKHGAPGFDSDSVNILAGFEAAYLLGAPVALALAAGKGPAVTKSAGSVVMGNAVEEKEV